MTLRMIDRASETTTTSGTGSVALHGALPGFVAFSSGMGNGDTTYYFIEDQVALQWEVQLGTYSSSGNSLSRPTPLASSNGGALVSFAGNAGTRVSSDIPAALAILIGSIKTVTDGTTSVTNATTIDFTSGGTVTNLGGGIAGVAVSGGGGSYTAGLGIYITSHTIGNTGTIMQPDELTPASALGIVLRASKVTNPGTAFVAAGGLATVRGGNGYASNAAGLATGGALSGSAGWAYGGVAFAVLAEGADFSFQGGKITNLGSTATGGTAYLTGGAAYGAVTNIGGDAGVFAGLGAQKGGNVTLAPGSGATMGNVIVTPLPTSATVTGALWNNLGVVMRSP